MVTASVAVIRPSSSISARGMATDIGPIPRMERRSSALAESYSASAMASGLCFELIRSYYPLDGYALAFNLSMKRKRRIL
ncbi:hypothetical protein GFGA_1c1257 [Gluconobacter frateurii NBRC 103465]|nr:hypothetical protein GFGA_1c1257 [Gluconobacter frateurii NBRC 103465]